jgi:putative Mg2+ transporter-C (MgtC) family protein
MFDELMQKTMEDFSDLPDLAEAIRMGVRLLIAAILGGILGIDRGLAGKSAGMRTHMLVSLGAALFVLIPQQAGMSDADISRVIQGIVSGIGFLGAGAILRGINEGEIRGMTTAAGIWLTAAIGISAGLGREASAILGALLAFLILSSLSGVSDFFSRRKQKREAVDSK